MSVYHNPDLEIEKRRLQVASLRISPCNTRVNRPLLKRIIGDAKKPGVGIDGHLLQDLEVYPSWEVPNAWDVIDGGTRLLALRHFGVPSAECRIHWWVKTSEEAAALFRRLTVHRQPMANSDMFSSLLQEGWEPALRVQAAISAQGWEISRSTRYRGGENNKISATRALLQADQWGVVAGTCEVIAKAWSDLPVARNSDMVLGVAAVLKVYPEIGKRQDRLVSRLSIEDPARVIRIAREFATTRRTMVWVEIFDLILNYFNFSLPATSRFSGRPVPALTQMMPETIRNMNEAVSRGSNQGGGLFGHRFPFPGAK